MKFSLLFDHVLQSEIYTAESWEKALEIGLVKQNPIYPLRSIRLLED